MIIPDFPTEPPGAGYKCKSGAPFPLEREGLDLKSACAKQRSAGAKGVTSGIRVYVQDLDGEACERVT